MKRFKPVAHFELLPQSLVSPSCKVACRCHLWHAERGITYLFTYPSLMYDGTSIDFVESFKYLGVDMHCTQPFAEAGLPRKESGQRAMLAMLHSSRELGIDDPLLQVRLFDALVQPVMMFAVELWGAGGVAKGELAGDLVHRDFLRESCYNNPLEVSTDLCGCPYGPVAVASDAS